MAKHLPPHDLALVRAFIARRRRSHPDEPDRAMFQALLAEHPHLDKHLGLDRFRYHVRVLREEAARLGVEVGALELPTPALDTSDLPLSSAEQRLVSAKRNLDHVLQEEVALLAELAAKRAAIVRQRGRLAHQLEQLFGGEIQVVIPEPGSGPGDLLDEAGGAAREQIAVALADEVHEPARQAVLEAFARYEAIARHAVEAALLRTDTNLERPVVGTAAAS